MGQDMSLVKGADVKSFTPEAGMVRQVLAHNDHLMLIRHFFEKGWVGARHSHPHEQLVYIIRGKLKVDIDGKKPFEVESGESFVVDGGVEHQATALEESEVLDVFTPLREDYKELVTAG
jgi:quercetin dioxygenase-like cupin family protein